MCWNNGFVCFGVAPAYLNIAGEWQDHAVYQQIRGRQVCARADRRRWIEMSGSGLEVMSYLERGS